MSSNAFSMGCKQGYAVSEDGIDLEWTAYKTPLKIGVGGKFRELGVTKTYQGKTLSELLSGLEFNIDSASTSTKNTSRDAKIVKYFFQKMTGGLNITGSIKEYKQKTLYIEINMNKHTQIIPLKAEISGDQLTANGFIDVFDFGLNESLKGINKACEKLHEGKTWNDVGVSLKIDLKSGC